MTLIKLKSLLLAALLALLPGIVTGQTNVKKAFDALLKSSDVTYTESHSLDRDVTSGVKEAQSDVYNFTLPESKIALVNNIVKAFKADEAQAYNISSGRTGKNESSVSLAVGQDTGSGVSISAPGREYIYACFLAPKKENPSGKYRYAYALSWEIKNRKINGKLVVTYATTLKHRQSTISGNGLVYLNGYPISADSSDDWFNTMMTHIQGLTTNNVRARNLLAAKIYKLAQSSQTSKTISKEDKEAVREVLKSQVSGFDPVTDSLLQQALVNIK
ncbi:MAG: hypothetical protein K2G64_02555 [Muribaculaceae bacterium]|nr:hypothetical protein [Muribaculaceae bacterium]MDE7393675.1 hypothetical protein [Muribaculaceae bacterium]